MKIRSITTKHAADLEAIHKSIKDKTKQNDKLTEANQTLQTQNTKLHERIKTFKETHAFKFDDFR